MRDAPLQTSETTELREMRTSDLRTQVRAIVSNGFSHRRRSAIQIRTGFGEKIDENEIVRIETNIGMTPLLVPLAIHRDASVSGQICQQPSEVKPAPFVMLECSEMLEIALPDVTPSRERHFPVVFRPVHDENVNDAFVYLTTTCPVTGAYKEIKNLRWRSTVTNDLHPEDGRVQRHDDRRGDVERDPRRRYRERC